jgi:hypothetical protein
VQSWFSGTRITPYAVDLPLRDIYRVIFINSSASLPGLT